jgi:hypothetical protein
MKKAKDKIAAGLPEINALIVAGEAYRSTILSRADGTLNGYPFWHGWALMDAFLAGAAHARKKETK